MRTAGESVQQPDAERGVSMFVGGFLVRNFRRVKVDVDVAFAAVFVFVGVDGILQRLAKSPESDADEHHADETFAPGGEQLNRQQLAQHQREQADDHHARRMPETPAQAGEPRALRMADGKGRNGREMVGSRPDVARACDQSAEKGDEHEMVFCRPGCAASRGPKAARTISGFKRECHIELELPTFDTFDALGKDSQRFGEDKDWDQRSEAASTRRSVHVSAVRFAGVRGRLQHG